MNRLLLLVALLGLVALPAGAVALTAGVADRLRGADVVTETAADVSAGDVARLDQAAADLRSRGFPTKFVLVANASDATPAAAGGLRSQLRGVATVIVLGPHAVGISSVRVRPDIFEQLKPQFRVDPVGGAIALADRLATAGSGSSSSSPSRRNGYIGLGVLGALVIGGILLFRTRARARARREVEESRAALEPLVDALAAKIVDNGPQVDAGGPAAERAKADHDAAVLAFGEARDALPRATSAPAVAEVRATLQRGLRSARVAEARLEGREPAPDEPLLGGLCTFDPKHGRAVSEVEITTPAGTPAQLPVCRRCADALERGDQPELRRVPFRGRQVPYWQGAGMGGGFGGSLFPFIGGFLLADLLTPGPAFGADPGWYDQGGGDWGGGGDFGGGFGGGGDFGGDFGGGGGGDFGGGF